MFPLDIPPGMYRNGTEYQAQGRWYDGRYIRFFEGTTRPVGGWEKAVPTPLDGPARGMMAWRRNTGSTYVAIGTVDSLVLFDNDSVTDITPAFFEAGVEDTVPGVGFGAGLFGAGPFGTLVGGGARNIATTWSLAAWGDYLLAMATHDGALYEWTGNLASPAALVANAPTGTSFFVTQEQIVVVLGVDGDLRLVGWSDVQDNTQWTPLADNLAGDHKMVTDGVLMAGMPVRGGNLILTNVDAHFMEYVGPNQVYRFQQIDTGCGLIGKRALATFQNGNAIWMSNTGRFFTFDGASVRPLACEVADYIFSDFNWMQAAKVYCATNQAYGEVTFFYPSAGSDINDRSVTWNFLEGHWTLNGQPARTAWQDAGVFQYPFAVDVNGYLYSHEKGWTADGADRTSQVYVQSGPVEIGNGDQVIYVLKIVPDEVTPGAWAVRFATRFSPENPEWNYGPYTLNPFSYVRLAGRQVAVRIEGVTDGDTRIGRFRFEGSAGGLR